MHPKRKNSNEKAAQFFTVAAKALRRFMKQFESIDMSEWMPEHRKDAQNFIDELDHMTTREANSAERAAESYKSNITE